jgi:hypothetical protein
MDQIMSSHGHADDLFNCLISNVRCATRIYVSLSSIRCEVRPKEAWTQAGYLRQPEWLQGER